MKYWDKKYDITADMIVIEGPEAGGHLGFGAQELVKYQNESYDDEVLKIKQVVQKYRDKYSKHIPIVLAGGISSKEDTKHAFALGMDGVQVGSAFVLPKSVMRMSDTRKHMFRQRRRYYDCKKSCGDAGKSH